VIPLESLAEAWRAFFHAREPATTIGLFRILFGLLLLANALLFIREAGIWIGPRGVLSHDRFRQVFGRSRVTTPFGHLAASGRWGHGVLAVHVLAAMCLTLGLATRWSAVVVFLTLVSVQQRNPLVLYGADDVMRIMSFLLIFSRAGEALSMDQWLAGRAGDTLEGSAWCTRLMQLQVSIVYLRAFLAKFSGTTWLAGTAAYYAVEVADFRRRRLPAFARTLFWSRLATWTTIGIEFGLGPLVWVEELRYPMLLAGVALHLTMEWFMNLQLFGATMIVCLVLFVDPYDLERWVRSAGWLG
jgi:hypothetical protein